MINKFKIIRSCTNNKPKKDVKPFNKRKIDIIIFFEKYKDFDYSKQGIQLLKLFYKTSKTIKRIEYGNYTKEKMKYLANNSQFIIYFSFFDTGAIGLKEIQNYGVFTFSHQKDLIVYIAIGFYVPELANKKNIYKAYKIIMEKIEIITNLNPNSQSLVKINQKINKCKKALNDLCESIL